MEELKLEWIEGAYKEVTKEELEMVLIDDEMNQESSIKYQEARIKNQLKTYLGKTYSERELDVIEASTRKNLEILNKIIPQILAGEKPEIPQELSNNIKKKI